MRKKLIVIGAGIAGLSAAVYALKCGFDVTVLESHSIPGGNCTSWKRKGYLFEGGMHWLSGSNTNEALNKSWRHIGALDDTVAIHYPEPFMTYDHDGTEIRIYRDADETEKHFMELSPDDKAEIKKLLGNIRKVKNLAMPVTDIKGVKTTRKARLPLSLLFSALSAGRLLSSFSKISREQYISRFKHEGIREMLRSSTSDQNGALPLFFTMGVLARGDGGFPEGGSLPFAARVAKTVTDLGGEILYSTRADRVVIENGKATGVVYSGETHSADAVLVAADTMAMDHLFETPPKATWLDEMRETAKPTTCVLISLGINADLSKYPRGYIFKLKTPISLADLTFEYLSINNYASDPIYSPAGKTALTTILDGDSYDFWKKAREEGSYSDAKQKIADDVIAAISEQIPELIGNVEVIDVATPLTYERYCGNWKGSWMTEMLPGMKMRTYPSVISGLSGVYFAGHRLIPPGGLPPALMSARTAIQHLCRDTGTLFVSEE